MSFLTFLFFASVVYLCAVADPIEEAPADPTVEGSAEPVYETSEGPTDVAPPTTSDQERVNQFMADVGISYDKEISPLLTGLSAEDKDCLKTSTMDGIGSLINNVIQNGYKQNGESPNTEGNYIVFQYTQEPSQPGVACQKPVVNQNNCNPEQ